VVEPAHAAPGRDGPGGPVVEGANPEQGRHRGRIERGRQRGPGGVGEQDEQGAAGQRHEEGVLVRHPAQPRLHTDLGDRRSWEWAAAGADGSDRPIRRHGHSRGARRIWRAPPDGAPGGHGPNLSLRPPPRLAVHVSKEPMPPVGTLKASPQFKFPKLMSLEAYKSGKPATGRRLPATASGLQVGVVPPSEAQTVSSLPSEGERVPLANVRPVDVPRVAPSWR
jgi:hypothetical protein